MPALKWTEEKLIADALKYKTRKEWESYSNSAYQVARNRGLLDTCCGHMESGRFLWTDDNLIADALKYKTRSEWQRDSRSAYTTAHKRGLLDVCCAHMNAVYIFWTIDALKADALKYKTRIEWRRDSYGAYQSAHKRKLLDVCCTHMESGLCGTDNDAVYIWKAIGQVFNGEQIYKIGVTSSRLGKDRILFCANKADFDAEIVIIANVNGKATEVEKSLLSIGADPKYVGFNGCTEFRAMTAAQLNRAIDIINSNIKQQMLAA
jgi:hypothetical protein